MVNKQNLFAVFILGIFLLVPSIHATQYEVSVTYAIDLEEESMLALAKATFDNITAEIDQAASAGVGADVGSSPIRVFIPKAKVMIASGDYSKKNIEAVTGVTNVFHAMDQYQITQFVKAKAALAAGQGASSEFSQKFSIEMFNSIATANDTGIATGQIAVNEEKTNIADFKGTTEYQTNFSAQYTDQTVVDAKYAEIVAGIPQNESWDTFYTDPTEKEKTKFHVNYFTNLRANLEAVLQQTIAANYSTVSYVIDPNDVTIFDYDLDMTDPELFVSYMCWNKNLDDQMRERMDDLIESAKASVLLWGLKISTVAASSTEIAGLSLPKIPNIIKIAKQSVISPLQRAVFDEPKKIIKNIQKEVSSGCPTVTGILKKTASNVGTIPTAAAVSAGTTMVKGIGFNSPKEMMTEGGNWISEKFTWFTGFLSKALNYLPFILGGIIILVILGLVGWFVLQRFILGRAPDNEYRNDQGWKPY